MNTQVVSTPVAIKAIRKIRCFVTKWRGEAETDNDRLWICNNFIPWVPYFSNHQFVTTYIKCSTKPFVPISIKVFHYCDRHNMVALNQNHLSLMARAVLILKTIIRLRQIQKLRAKVCSIKPHKTLLVNRFNYFHIELWNSSAFKEICFIFWVVFHNTISNTSVQRKYTISSGACYCCTNYVCCS